MRDYVIVVDNCSNLTKEKREKYGIEIVYMHFFIDEKIYDASPDYEVVSNKTFYDTMRNGKRITTSQATAEEFEAKFEKIVGEGKDILYIGCSSKLSASVKEGDVAKDVVMKKHPEAKIVVIDSRTSCFALAMMVKDAAERKNAGMSLEENAKVVEETKYCYNYIATTEKLTYLKQAGRVSAPSAFFGGLLSVKPLIVNSRAGENVAVEKVKGRRNSFERTGELVKEVINTEGHNVLYVGHADAYEDAKEYANVIMSYCEGLNLEVEFGVIEPCVGASVGPGTVVVDLYTQDDFRDKWEATR